MAGYTKLFSSIVHSTIWREPHHIRIVWVTMLAMSDARGEVMASAPGLADLARVTIAECREALQVFQSPDADSGNLDHEGRRIEPIRGGWRLLNHGVYRELMSSDERRSRDAERKRAERAASKDRPGTSEIVHDVSHSEAAPDPSPTPAPTGSQSFAPEEFAPTEAHGVRCQELKLDVAEQVRMFKLHEFNRPYSDWPRRFGKWLEESKVRRETDQAKAIAAAQRPRQGSFAPVPVLSPNTKHRAFAEAQGIDLDALIRKMVDEQIVQRLGLGRAREIIGERLVAAAKKRKANNVNKTP